MDSAPVFPVFPVFIDSDNALGSPSGDPDDGFAIAALLLSAVPVAGVSSVFGNTSEARAHQNNASLARLCRWEGPLPRGATRPGEHDSEAARALAAPARLRIAALGPLTNIAAALASGSSSIEEVVAVGGNARSRGRWPPLWPHEFNLTADRAATRAVFESDVPLTLATLDVARAMTVGQRDIAAIDGPLGAHLATHSRRWFRRTLLRRAALAFPCWDLVAALYLIDPALFHVAEDTARLAGNGWLEFGAGTRPLRRIVSFARDAVWSRAWHETCSRT